MSSSMLVDAGDLFDELIDSDLNPEVFNLNMSDFKRAPNIIEWVKSPKFINITPFARQVEILTGLFEDHCVFCSDMDVVRDMWGLSLDEIFRKVSFLEHDTCPSCKRTRKDFREAGLVKDYHELVGVAGQRCMDPDTLLITFAGTYIRLRDVKPGTWLKKQHCDGSPAIVKEVIGSVQPGHFKLWVEGLDKPFLCSDQHIWPIVGQGHLTHLDERMMPAAELKPGMLLRAWDSPQGFKRLARIEKVRGRTEMVDLEIHDHHLFRAACGLALHNSGKTALSAMVSTYITHQYLTLDGMPYEALGLTPTTIRGVFVATSKGQASETLWQNVLDLMDGCQWYTDYHEHLTEEGYRKGEEYFKRLNESITYYNKALALSFESANPAKLRGRTRFLGSLDELGLFPSGEQYAESGQECYTSLNNSLRTVRSATREQIQRGAINPPRGWMISVSSPIAEDDPIMPLLETAKTSSKMFAFHHPTWEINPTITMDDLKDEMLKDPKKFWRDFGAQPPTASDAFIGQPQMIDAIVQENVPNSLIYDFGRVSQSVGTATYYYRVLRVLGTRPHDVDYPRLLAIDAGETENSYGFVIGYYDFEREKVVTEAIAEIEPETTSQGQVVTVSFDKANEVFFQLQDIFNIKMAVADRWNSTLTLEQLRNKGIEAFKHSPKLHEFKLFRARIFNRESELPAYDADKTDKHPPATSPVARCVIQAKMVKEGANKLYKPAIGSDDVFRSWALLDIVATEYKDTLKELWEQQKRLKEGPGKGQLFGLGHRVRGNYGAKVGSSGGLGGSPRSGNSTNFRRVTRGKKR